MARAFLTDRAVLAVQGEDARTFLQGLISNDIRKVTPGHAVFATLLSPQGKYLFEFFICEHEGTLLLETAADRMPALISKLGMYRLRSKVTWQEKPEMAVLACWAGAEATSGILHYADPRHPSLGQRVIVAREQAAGNDDYEEHRIALGIPEGGKDLVPDRALLLEFGYDHLNAVDFAKGCYVGQEVTARSKHRATLHKYVHCVEANGPLPSPGTPVLSGDKEVGELRSHRGNKGLALLRHKEAAEGLLKAGGVALRAYLPQWLKVGL